MSDTDLAVTGKDCQVQIVEAGVPVRLIDAVISRSAEPVFDVVRQKHLGTSNVDIDPEHAGWKGELEVSDKSAEVDELLDTVISKGRLRVATVINYVETTHYRNGTSKTYIYPDIKIVGAPKSSRRAEATSTRLSWETGKNRIAA